VGDALARFASLEPYTHAATGVGAGLAFIFDRGRDSAGWKQTAKP